MSRDDAFIKRRDTVLSPGKVTVIVITWNSLQYVKQTFPALLKQQYRSIEYVIVDNGSIDGTVEFFKNEIDKSSEKQITLIENKENQGISIAKNQGVRHSSGDYVLLLDDDILIQNHHFIANIVDYYSKLPDPAFLMPFF
ncbi:MAG: glycosyltransferase family 2 protein, partial [Chitinispirillaceae bacterium]